MDTEWKTFVCRYYHNGKWWGLNIMAPDWKDAEARVAKLGNLMLLGELKGSIPAGVPASGFFVRSFVKLRNFFRA